MSEISVLGRKKSGRTFFNLFCSVAEHGISACLALVITPFLIKKLGMELYGLYPIALEISSLFGVVFGVVNSTSGRYVAVEEEQGNRDVAVEYFSTTFFANAAIGGLTLLPMAVAAIFPHIFLEIPDGSLDDVRVFMCLMFAAVIFDALCFSFGSVYYITSRLDIRSAQQLTAALVKAVSLGLLLTLFGASLTGVGVAVLLSSAVGGFVQIFVFKRLADGIRLSFSKVSRMALKRLISSGFWYSLNRLATLLMCGGLLVLSNSFFDGEASGLYSVAFVAVNAASGVITMLASVFVPMSAKCFARGEQKRLCDMLSRDRKAVGCCAAASVAVFIAFCDEFYRLWLGGEPPRLLLTLSVILIIPLLSLACAAPIINLGMVINKTKKLALVFFGGGLLTFAAALWVIFYTEFSVIGVALTSCFAQTIWYSVAVPLFAARVLKRPIIGFFIPICRTFLAAFVSLGVCLLLSSLFRVEMWAELFIVAGAAAAISAVISFFCLFESIKFKKRS